MSAPWATEAESHTFNFSKLRVSNIEASAFCHFKSECKANGLLARPKDVTSDDLCDGINDDVTLL